MKTLLRSICMIPFLITVILCAAPVTGKNHQGLQVISIEGALVDSAGSLVGVYDILEPGRNYRLLPEAKVLLSTLDGKKTYTALGPGGVFLDASGLVSLDGKALKPKDQYPLLQGVTAAASKGQQLAGIPDGHPKSPTCGHLKIPHLKRFKM